MHPINLVQICTIVVWDRFSHIVINFGILIKTLIWGRIWFPHVGINLIPLFRPGAGSHDPDITAAELQGLVTVAVDRYRDLQSSTADRPHSGYQTGRYFPSARFSPGVVQQTVEPITALWEFLAFMPLDCMLRSDYRKKNPVDNIFFPW